MVDRLGGERVAELVGVDVADPGASCAMRRTMRVTRWRSTAEVSSVRSRPVRAMWPAFVLRQSSMQLDEGRVQRDVAVVAEFADRDVQPVRRRRSSTTGVGGEVAELADAHPGAGEHQRRRVVRSGSGSDRRLVHELGGIWSSSRNFGNGSSVVVGRRRG